MTQSIKVAIVGCGDIAGGYDERRKGEGVFSHAGAYRLSPDIEIVSAFDIDTKRLDNFCHYWSVNKSCRSLDELLDGKYEIISVCTPDDTHQTILENILESGCTKYIWAEKPLTSTAEGAENIIKTARSKGIGLWLSNQRRWEPGHLMVRKKIQQGAIGDLIHATGYYVKGITHIGCAIINALRFLCGEVAWVMAFPPFEAGSYERDLSLRGILGFQEGGTASIIGCDIKKYVYSLFEIDIIGMNGRIKIEKNGDIIRIYEAQQYGHYAGFNELKPIENIDTEMKWAMKYGLDLLLKDFFEKRCSTYLAEEGLKDLQVVEALKQSAEKGGIRVGF